MDSTLFTNLLPELESEGIFRDATRLFHVEEGFTTDRWRVHICNPETGALVDRVLMEVGEELTVTSLLAEVNGR